MNEPGDLIRIRHMIDASRREVDLDVVWRIVNVELPALVTKLSTVQSRLSTTS
jgi:uncharacterized protein with HEPN domain